MIEDLRCFADLWLMGRVPDEEQWSHCYDLLCLYKGPKLTVGHSDEYAYAILEEGL